MEKKDMQPCGFKVGELAVFDGVVGVIVSISPVYTYEYWLLTLESVEDKEMSCTVTEQECKKYLPDGFDKENESERLSAARFNSAVVLHQIDRLTDKYIGDCSY